MKSSHIELFLFYDIFFLVFVCLYVSEFPFIVFPSNWAASDQILRCLRLRAFLIYNLKSNILGLFGPISSCIFILLNESQLNQSQPWYISWAREIGNKLTIRPRKFQYLTNSVKPRAKSQMGHSKNIDKLNRIFLWN